MGNSGENGTPVMATCSNTPQNAQKTHGFFVEDGWALVMFCFCALLAQAVVDEGQVPLYKTSKAMMR